MSVMSFLPRRSAPLDPPPLLRELQRREPVSRATLWDGQQVWLVTRHADACALLQDRRVSSDWTHPRFPRTQPGQMVALRLNMGRVDGPEHTRLRQAISHEFTHAAMNRMRPAIEQIVNARFDEILQVGPPTDCVETLTARVPAEALKALLGVPDELLPEFWSVFAQKGWSADGTIADVEQAQHEFAERLTIHKEHHRTDDLLGRAAAGGRMSHAELANLTAILLIAGRFTTEHTAGMCVLTLLLDATLFASLRDHPDRVPNAVDELLRYHTIIQQGLRRVALADIDIAGVRVRSGDRLVILVHSANRDEQVFPAPDQVDISRPTARHHLAFGHGPHVCIGQWLARLELQVLLTTLVQRVPTLKLAVSFDALRFSGEMPHYAVRELPVTWQTPATGPHRPDPGDN